MITPVTAFAANNNSSTTTQNTVSNSAVDTNTDEEQEQSTTVNSGNTTNSSQSSSTDKQANGETKTEAQPRAPTNVKSINDLLPADAEGNKTIFTNAKITDANGNVVQEVHVGDNILLQYEWSVPESIRDQINAGDTFSFTLPKGMKIDKQLTGDLSDSQGTVFGHFEINPDGSAKITFTDNVQKHSNIKGTLFVSGQISMNNDGTNPGLDIPFVDSHNVQVPDVVIPGQVGLSKKVVSQTKDSDIKDNQAKVTWELGINKTASSMKKGTTITDNLPTGVTYDGNEHLKSYDVYADGTLHNEKNVTFSDVFTIEHQDGKVMFKLKDDADHQKYYALQFDTKVDFTKVDSASNATNVTINNTAELNQPGDSPIQAGASTTFGYGVTFNKKGTMQDNGVIKWTITVNRAGMPLPKGTAFTDKMTNNQTLTDKNGKVLDDISDAINSDGPKIITSGSSGNYTFTLGETTDKNSFQMTYYTKSTSSKPGTVYNNTISWGNSTTNTGKVDQTSGIVKTHTDIDTEKHTANYRITVNKNNNKINKASVIDQMDTGSNAGLTMSQDQIDGIKVYRINSSGDKAQVDKADYTITPDGTAPFTKFTVDLDRAVQNGTTDSFTVEYKASYDASKRGDDQSNTAIYTYETNGFDYSDKAKDTINPGARATMKGSKSGEINPLQGTINWTINLNNDKKATFGANGKLVDTLPKGISLTGIDPNVQGEQPISKSAYKITKNGETVDNVTATYNTSNRKVTFTGFEKGSTDNYQIVLTTDIDANKDGTLPNLNNLTNTAQYSDDENQTSELTAKVSYNPSKDLVQKTAQQNDKKVAYTVKINPDTDTNSGDHKMKLRDVVVQDKPDDTSILRVDPNSFKITDKQGNQIPESQYKLSAGEQGFTLTFNDVVDQEIDVTYEATILIPSGTLPGQTIKPSNTVVISGNKINGSTTNKDVTLIAPNAGGSAEGTLGSISLTKQDTVTNKALQGAKFSLYRIKDDGGLGNAVIQDQLTDQNGQLKFANLTLGKYKVIETEAPKGYQISPELAVGKVVTVSDTNSSSLNVALTLNNDAVTTIEGHKSWNDHDNQDGLRPNKVTVHLLANGKQVAQQEVTATDDWKYSFKNQPVYNKDGQKINYTIQETKVPDYTSQVTGFDLTNSHTPEATSVQGNKTWNDHNDQDGIRPSTITVNLLADGKQVDSQQATAENNWKYSFTNLPKYQNGQKIKYTVTENEVPGYSTKIEGNNIKNNYTPEQTSVTVTKNWNDQQNQDGLRPKTIEVQLYANGQKSGKPVTLSEVKNWTYTWSGLDAKRDGQQIRYSVREAKNVPGYSTQIDEKNQGNIIITNTYQPSTTQVTGVKKWDDNSNQDGIRPKSITVNLLANGQQIASKKVTATDDWQYKFNNLPEYQHGKKIVYTVTENIVKDYSAQIKGYDVINHYTPMKTSLTVTKNWNDQQNQDGLRPKTIEVQLYANGQKSGKPVTLSEVKNWTYTWSGLDAKRDGQQIRYSVREAKNVPGYSTQIDEKNQGNIIITNTHQPKTPNQPSSPNTPNRPETIHAKTVTWLQKHHLLPQTSDQTTLWLTVIGVIILVSIGGLWIRKRLSNK